MSDTENRDNQSTTTELTGAKSAPPEAGIGERIKQARQRAGYDLSIEALSRLCKDIDSEGQGITSTTLLRYEQGKVLPGARELRVICYALDVSADWLLTGEDNPMEISMSEGIKILQGLILEKEAASAFWRRGARRGLNVLKQEKILAAKTGQKR